MTLIYLLHVPNHVYNYRNMLIMNVCGTVYLVCISWSIYALQFDVCKHSHVISYCFQNIYILINLNRKVTILKDILYLYYSFITLT